MDPTAVAAEIERLPRRLAIWSAGREGVRQVLFEMALERVVGGS